MAKAGYSHCQDSHNNSKVLCKDGSMSAVALSVCHASLTHRGWHPCSTVVDVPQLRQNYITPHFRKCRAVIPLKLHFVPCTAARPHGFPKKALCKIAFAGPGLSATCTPQPLRVLRAVVCRPSGVLALCHTSGALRLVSVSGFAVYVVCAPTLGACLLRSIARAVCPYAPQGGSFRNRAMT